MSEVKSVSTLTGRVTSSKRDKTRTVEVEWSRRHPTYKKVVKGITKFHAHDENNESKEGDLVEIRECRPVSKTKTWVLVKVVEQAQL